MRNYRRLFSCLSLLIVGFFYTSNALSQLDNQTKTGEDSEEITDKNICKELVEHQKNTGLKEKLSDFKEVLDFVFNKNKLGKPDLQSVSVDPQKRVSPAFSNSGRGKNYIISLGVDKPSEITDQEFINQTQEYKKLTSKIEAQAKILARMSSTSSRAICSLVKRLNNFSWETYQADIEKKSQFIWGKRHLEFLEVENIVNRELPKLQKSWHFVRDSSIENVYRILRSPSTRNVILMNHGREIGEILDANDSFYPPSFFKGVSPSVRSLSFFACHSSEAINYYDLKNIFAANPSFFSERFLFSVRANQFMKQKNIAVLSSLKYFLRGVDSYLSKNDPISLDHWRPVHKSLVPTCSLKSSDFSLLSGTVGISLNGQFVNAMSANKSGISATFDCNLLKKDGENIVVLSNLRFNQSEQTSIASENFEINILIPENYKIDLTFDSRKTVFNSDSSFRKSIFKFRVVNLSVEDVRIDVE